VVHVPPVAAQLIGERCLWQATFHRNLFEVSLNSEVAMM